VNYKRKSRRRFFLLMRSRTPPISSEFRGGGGFEHPKPPLGTPLPGCNFNKLQVAPVMCAGHVPLCAALWSFLLIILVTESVLHKTILPSPERANKKKKRSRLPYFGINHVIYNPDKLWRKCKKCHFRTHVGD